MKKQTKIILATFVIPFIIVLIVVGTLELNSGEYHVNVDLMLSEGRLQETENGYVEVLPLDTTVTNKRTTTKYSGMRRRKHYTICYYNEEMRKAMGVGVSKDDYEKFNKGDKVRVTRYVYYNKEGLRLYFIDKIELLGDGGSSDWA